MSPFKWERRRNDTYQSRTDRRTKLKRKGPGKEAKPCFAGHALMDNRHCLITDVSTTPSVGVSDSEALLLLARQRRKRLRSKGVGADKGHHTHGCVEVPREKRIAPDVALNERYHALGLGRGVRESRAYRASQIVRKRIEQFFGWGKDGRRQRTKPQRAALVPDRCRLQPRAHESIAGGYRVSVCGGH
jgi:hypothetical protein